MAEIEASDREALSSAVLSEPTAVNRSVAIQVWIIGALVPVALLFIGEGGQRDFDLLWAAAKLVLTNQGADIYTPDLVQVLADRDKWGDAAVFPYPPHALFFLLPFGLLPHLPAYLAWDLTTAALFYWAARPYLPRGIPPILSILTPASIACLDFGQTGLLVGALWLWAFRGQWAAVALLTFKPHLGFLSILSIRNRRNLLLVTILALLLIAASAICFGPSLWSAFVDRATGHVGRAGSLGRWFFTGVAPAMAYGFWGWVPFAIAGGLLLARNVNVFTASTASFLISPFGFHYDMTVASLGFGIAIALHWNSMPVRHRIPIALGFLSPVIAFAGAWWVPPLLLWSLWAQTKYGAGPLARELSPPLAAFTGR